jgi:hypothetical protein
LPEENQPTKPAESPKNKAFDFAKAFPNLFGEKLTTPEKPDVDVRKTRGNVAAKSVPQPRSAPQQAPPKPVAKLLENPAKTTPENKPQLKNKNPLHISNIQIDQIENINLNSIESIEAEKNKVKPIPPKPTEPARFKNRLPAKRGSIFAKVRQIAPAETQAYLAFLCEEIVAAEPKRRSDVWRTIFFAEREGRAPARCCNRCWKKESTASANRTYKNTAKRQKRNTNQ